MDFGRVIKKLRHEKVMTQEQLAEKLSVSPQAVSRWENNTAMPDISLLPPIAHLFHVTVDYLLGVDIRHEEEHICKIIAQANALIENAPASVAEWDHAIAILRQGIRLYPDNWDLKKQLAEFLFYSSNGDIERLREMNDLCEEIIAYCTHTDIIFTAVSLICRAARESNNTQRAANLVDILPSVTESREEMKLCLLEGEAYDKVGRDYIQTLLICLREVLLGLANRKEREEIAYYYQKANAIAQLLYDGDDFINSEYFWQGQLSWALRFARAGDCDQAYACLTRQLDSIHKNMESPFDRLSPLLPEWIRRDCAASTPEWLRAYFLPKLEMTLEAMEKTFPSSFRTDERYIPTKEGYMDLVAHFQKE